MPHSSWLATGTPLWFWKINFVECVTKYSGCCRKDAALSTEHWPWKLAAPLLEHEQIALREPGGRIEKLFTKHEYGARGTITMYNIRAVSPLRRKNCSSLLLFYSAFSFYDCLLFSKIRLFGHSDLMCHRVHSSLAVINLKLIYFLKKPSSSLLKFVDLA